MPAYLVWAVALFGVWLFGTAALHKFRHPLYYRSLMQNWFPGMPSGRGLPPLLGGAEGLVALTLVMPGLQLIGLRAGAVLLVLYAFGMGVQLYQGKRGLRCGCAGPASDLNLSPALIMRNVLCAVALFCASLPGLGQIASGLVALVFTGLTAIFMVVLYMAFEQLLGNQQRARAGA